MKTATPAVSAPNSARKSRGVSPSPASKGRVLLIDDDESVRESISRVLRSECYEVVTGATAAEGIDNYCKGYIDLVLLDLNLPDRSGWDVLERITALNPFAIIIVITARPDQYELASVAGATALMEKPFHWPELLDTIAKLMNEPPAQHARRAFGHNPLFVSAQA